MKAKDAKTEAKAAEVIEGKPDEAKVAKLPSGFTVSRVLKETSPAMSGSDVKALQAALINAGYGCGKNGADGIFGHKTMLAVRALQGDKRLTVNGIAGKRTIETLGGSWKG